MNRIFVALLGVVFSLAMLAPSAQAQVPLATGNSGGTTEIALPDPLTPEAIREVVAQMSDDQVRAVLLERLDAVAAEQTPAMLEPTLLEKLQFTASAFGASLLNVVQNVPNLVSTQAESFTNFADKFEDGQMLWMFGMILLTLVLAYAIERTVMFLVQRRWKSDPNADYSDDLWGATRYLFRRFIREMLGLVIFYVAIRTIGPRLLSPAMLAFAGPFVVYLIWIPRLSAAIARFVLAPSRADLRLVNVDDHWANYLYRNLIGLFLLTGFTIFIVGFNDQNGVAMGATRLGFWLNTAVHVYIAFIAWTARAGLTDIVRGTDPDRTEFDEWVARNYPYYAVGVAIAMWFLVEIIVAAGPPEMLILPSQGPHYTTMFWLLAGPALDTLIRGLVRHLLPPMIGEGAVAEAAYKSTKRSFVRIGRVLVGGIVILLIANVWQIDLISLRGRELAGADFFQFLITLAIGYIVYEGVSLWINRRLAREQTSSDQTEDEAAGEGGGVGGSRLATVLPLVRVTAQVAIAIIFFLLALGNLGIDITPLLAGAGILGLAIGFGAQKLVADIVGGVFFLIDDAFRVGEYVDVGGTMGTVEKISIRSMQLRHHRGAVHTIPYGEIQKLTNFSRDWVIMKLMFTVPFDTDPNKIKKIFKKIGAEMLADPVHGPGFIEPFKSQGVFNFDDVGMVVRGKFMAKPGGQFTIRKEIYNRVKKEFDEAGIAFARREVRVAIPGLEHVEDMTAIEKAAVGGAAAGAVQSTLDQQKDV